MPDRIRPHILATEARCRCGCGLTPSGKWLDTVNTFIDLLGAGTPISTMARCAKYNKQVKGVADSPHQLVDEGYGAADLPVTDPRKRMRMLKVAVILEQLGLINQVEICDRHIHIASVPPDHRLSGLANWGQSN